MSAFRKFVSEHPLVVFVILAYFLSWWSIPFANGGILPQGPFFAALIVLGLTRGKVSVGELFRRMVSWRGSWYWLLVGPGLVIAYLLLALGLNLALGASITETAHLGSLGPMALMLVLLGGWWEEPGWTGYALPLLQERYAERPNGKLLASLHMGAIRALWHLPLVLSGAIPWYDMLIFSFAFQLLISWLYNRTGSVLIVMLFHLASNIIGGGIIIPLFSGFDHTRMYVLFIATAWLLAVALTWRGSGSLRYETDPTVS
jgi:membrane protease YdiL (CAAX protease family)